MVEEHYIDGEPDDLVIDWPEGSPVQEDRRVIVSYHYLSFESSVIVLSTVLEETRARGRGQFYV